MTKALLNYPEIKAFYEFQKGLIKSLVTQILQSPELTAQTNRLSLSEKKTYQKEIDRLADLVIKKELQYYQGRYELKTPQDFQSLIERLPEQEITDIRKRMCTEALENADS
jgi:hypothetical protein